MSRAIIIVFLVLAVLAAAVNYRLFLYTPKEFRQIDVAAYESEGTEMLVRELVQQAGTKGPAACFLAFGHRLTPPTKQFFLNRHASKAIPYQFLRADLTRTPTQT